MMKVAESSGRPGGHVLTPRQRAILQFIEEYAAANDCAPSDQEIAEGVGLKSRSSAHYHLRILKATGHLNYEEHAPRTVRVRRAGQKAKRKPGPAGAGKVVWVPVIGQVAAGEPIPPLASVQDRFPLPKEMVGAEEGLFILKVVGDSMTGAGIFPGDWVVVRRLYERPQNGDIVAALLAGYCAAVTAMIDLDRFALYDALRLRRPKNTAAERRRNAKLTALLYGDQEVVLRYKYPDPPGGQSTGT